MLSESARMSTAAEARYRVQAPNSRPRSIKVVGLDGGGGRAVEHLAEQGWVNASFFTVGKPGELKRLDGTTVPVTQEVANADLVVMVTAAEGRAHVAEEIGRVCSDRRVTTTTLVVGALAASDEALAK